MRILLLLSIYIIIPSIFNTVTAQINFSGCDEIGLTASYTLNATGSVTDGGIDRTVFESDPNLGNYGELIIIKWDTDSDQWKIFHNSFDSTNDAYNELLFSSTVATHPNPPNLTIGNWTNAGSEYTCEPIGVLSGDVEDVPPSVNEDPTLTGLPASITVGEDSTTDVFDIASADINDTDLGSGMLTLTLSANGGKYALANDSNLVLTGNASNKVTMTGTLFYLNNYVNHPTNMYFRPNENLSGDNAASVDVIINDNGNTGTGGGEDIFVGTVMVNITGVNDAPEITLPSSISVTEDLNTALTDISFSDVDAASGNVTVQMSVGAGSLFAIPGGGVTASGDGSTSISLTGTIANINAYIAGSNVEFQNQPGNLTSQTLSVSIDDGGNTGSGGNLIDTGTMTITIEVGNTTPTASSFVAENGPYENLTYVFGTGDFGYSDVDGDVLDHIIIQSLPTSGTLFADADNDDTYDGGEELSVGESVGKADLDAGNLQYIQNGSTNTSFQFNVSDGTDASTANYTVSLNVSPVPTVTLSVNPISKPENQTTSTIITATLSNSYGANTTVNLTTGGTIISMVDYALSDTEINISAGSTSETVILQNINDNLYENDETVILDIGSISNGIEDGSQQVTYTIINDDTPPNASLEILDIYNPITTESGGQAFVRGKIDNPSGATVSISLSFSGTAIGGGTDYAITGSVISISPGEVMDSIRVTSLFDELEEGDETIIIDMDTPSNAVESGTQQVTLTIKDDNLSPPSGYSVSIDQGQITAANQTNVSFTFSGAEVGATYNYTFSSDGGGTIVTGSGTVSAATDQITGIDLSGLEEGTVTLSATLTDSLGNIGVPNTSRSIKSINEAPIAVEDESSTDVNIPLTGNVLTNDNDPDGDTLTSSLVTAPVNGTIVLNADGSFTYSPNTDYVGLDSLMYQVCDNGIPSLCDTTMLRLNVIDTSIPSGYSVAWADDFINESEANATALKVSNAEVGTTLNYTLSSSGDGNTQTISGTESVTDTSADYIVDVSNLEEGTLTAEIFLTSVYGTPGIVSSDNSAVLDKTAPSGYAVSIDQDPIDGSNQSNVSFTFSGAEVGALYHYSFTVEIVGSSITGSGTVTAANQQVSGIDLSNIADGTITLSTSLEDPAGNIGASVTDTSIKETNIAPTASDVAVGGTLSVGEQLTGNYTFSDADGDPESNSTFLWYRSDDESGSGKTEISGAVSSQYTLQTADQGKYISFAVTPNDGIIAGPQVESPIIGPVKMDQMITFSEIEVKTYGDAPFVLGDAQTDQGLTVNYTATDPSVVEITGNQATILKAGITTVTATQAGDNQTNPAQAVTQTLEVQKAMLKLTADSKSKVYGEPDPEFTYVASGFVNGDDIAIVTGSLERVGGEDAGNYAITLGSLSGGMNYELQLETADFEILKADQDIIWNQELIFGCDSESQLTLTASSSSGLPVSYTVTDNSIAELSGDVLSVKASGSTTIIAQQPGDKNHNPAESIEKVINVTQSGLIRQQWDDVLVFDNSGGDFVSYQWYKDGTPIAGATKQYYSENGTLSGSYYAQATTQNGEVITTCVLELSGEDFTRSVHIVPNPASASSEFTVDCSFDQATLNGASISVIDLNGRLLQTVPVTGSQTILTAPTQRGVYVVVLSLGDGTRRTVNLLVN